MVSILAAKLSMERNSWCSS